MHLLLLAYKFNEFIASYSYLSLTFMILLQSINQKSCHVGFPTDLSNSLQQCDDQLPSPQCTNITYMYTFVNKMLLFLNDADVRNIVCHLNEAISNLNCFQVSTII